MKYIISLALVMTFLSSSVADAFWRQKPQGPRRNPDQVFEKNDIERPEDWGVMTREERRGYLESQGFTPPPPRQQQNRPGPKVRQQRQNAIAEQDIDLPEDWKEKEGEAKREFLQDAGFVPPGKERRQDHIAEQGIDLPEDWEEKTREEKKSYLEEQGFQPPQRPENRGEKFQHRQDFGQVQQRRDAALAEQDIELPENWEELEKEEKQEFLEDAGFERPERKRAKHYRKFVGQLKEKREFNDANKIRRKDAVQFLQRRGIIDGYADGSFGPENPINRAESLKVLFESIGEGPEEGTESEFEDVPGNAWFAGYVRKAKRRNIARGYNDGTFKPANTVNQVELLKLAFETFGIDLTDYDTSNLPEGIDANAWFAPYLAYAIDNQLLDPESVDPATGMTREEFSEVMYRLIKQQEEIQGIDLLEELSKVGLL